MTTIASATIRFYGPAGSLRAWRTAVAQRTGKAGGRIATDSGRDFFDIGLSAQDREGLMEDWRAESTTGGTTAQGRPFRWNECITFEERISDDGKNPVYFMQTADTSILVSAALGAVDLNEVVAREISMRGLDSSGKWVGFDKARAEFEARGK